jgi:hypothetical protein
MSRLAISAVRDIKEAIVLESQNEPIPNYGTILNLIRTIEDMHTEIEQLKADPELAAVKSRIKRLKSQQRDWKDECITASIDALTEPTHRFRDDACKKLLKHLRNMPEISPWDYAEVTDGLPF